MDNMSNLICEENPNSKGGVMNLFIASQIYGLLKGISGVFTNKQQLKDALNEDKESRKNDSKLQSDLQNIRDSYTASIKHQIENMQLQFANLRDQQDFKFFCEYFWLKQYAMTVNSIGLLMKEISSKCPSKINIQLMVAWTKSLDRILSPLGIDQASNYRFICKNIRSRIECIDCLSTSFINGWQKPSKSVTADIMNIHYVMQGIPTVLLFPKIKEEKLSVDIAMWGFAPGNNNLLRLSLFDNPIVKGEEIEQITDILCAGAIIAGNGLQKIISPINVMDGSLICNAISNIQIQKSIIELMSKSDSQISQFVDSIIQ